jgi:hypothetical protein
MANIERKTNNWPSIEEVNKERNSFCKKQEKHFVEIFEQNKLLCEFSGQEIELVSKILSCFMFGVNMAYFRFGFKFPNFNFAFDTREETDYHGIAFNSEFNGFFIKVKFLKDILQDFRPDKKCSIKGAGITEKIPIQDFFEIVGIEEASHLMFYNEKGYLGSDEIPQEDKVLQYFTNGLEFKALLWKLAYTKRYYPQYYQFLKPTYEKVVEIFSTARKKQTGLRNNIVISPETET